MTKKYKNILLISLVLLSQIHSIFRGSGIYVDWFLFIELKRSLNMSVFLLCVHLRIFILHFCLLFPKNIDKRLLRFLFALSIADIVHYFINSGMEYGLEKILIVFITLFIIEKYKRW